MRTLFLENSNQGKMESRQVEGREKWDRKVDFLLSSFGYCVRFGEKSLTWLTKPVEVRLKSEK